jgi:hypothetical protein
MIEGLLKDICYSIRGLRKRRGFTLKPLSFKDPDQLVWFW